MRHGTRICNNTSNHFKSIKKSRLAKVAATIEDSDLKMQSTTVVLLQVLVIRFSTFPNMGRYG